MLLSPLTQTRVVSINVTAAPIAEAAELVLKWGRGKESRVVCVANVHMAMEAFDDPDFSQIVNGADLTVPDGMPLVWVLRSFGLNAQRICGRDLIAEICKQASAQGTAVGLYGGSPHALEGMSRALRIQYPDLRLPYAVSPPFRTLTTEEDAAIVEQINASGVEVLLVGLGCPKQEQWMDAHRGHIKAAMVGVGAAFDFIGGLKPVAPGWMQSSGLEWLHRMCSEPGRLWRRYWHHNPRFVALAVRQRALATLTRSTSFL